jgi:uncharacterized lipoprotein
MRVLAVLALAMLAACHSEPSFDERYNAAEKQIRDTASEIDAELEVPDGASGPDEQARNASGQDSGQ